MTKDEALNIAIDYMNERLEEHDAKFQRHPVAEAERNNILADIEAVKEALAQPEQECKSPEPEARRPDVHCPDQTCGFLGECRLGYKPEQEPYWERVARIKEEMLRVSYEENKLLKEALAQPWEKFCDSNCVWTDHHPDCKLAEREPVVWMYQNKSTHEVRFQKHMRSFVDHGAWYEVPLYSEPLANQEKTSGSPIKEALAQPEQEPVTWRYKIVDVFGRPAWTLKTPKSDTRVLESQPLYTTPPQRKPLSDEEIVLIVAECASSHQHTDIHFARAIEQAHGIKGEA